MPETAHATAAQGEATRLLLTLCELHRACQAPAAALPYALSCQMHAEALGCNLLVRASSEHTAAQHSTVHCEMVRHDSNPDHRNSTGALLTEIST